MPQPMQVLDEVAIPYPTAIDLFESFSKGMHSLYLHAFLLTADHDQAEECLVWAIRECVEGPGVFMESTRLCIRKAVLKRAIELVVPVPECTDDVSLTSLKALEEKLPPRRFMRVHRSFIVSLDKITSINKTAVNIGKTLITVGDQYKDVFSEFVSRWG